MVYVVNTCGYGSFGDDCYLETLREHLSEVWPLSRIVVNRIDGASFSPDKQDAAVLGGGGMLYQHIYDCGFNSLKYFLRYPAAMQIFGKKTFALSVGVQGPLNAGHLEPYIEVLNAMSLRTVRDSQSANMLREAGVSAPIVESADLSYLVKLPGWRTEQTRKRPMLGVAASQPDKGVIYAESHGFEARLLDALRELDRDFDIHFYSFDSRSDGAVADGWPGAHFRSSYDPASQDAVNRFIKAIAESDIFLTSRLHGVTLCARMEIPFVSIGAPGEKVERESRALEHPFHLIYSVEAGKIAATVREAWANRQRISKNLESTAARQERLARKTVEALHACN